MMQAGNMGGEDSKGEEIPPESGKVGLSLCDVSSDDFKKAWLTLKELHDKELHRLQAKLTNLRKERLLDGRRTGSTAKIKELTEQQKVLSGTIQALRDQLRSKTCERCSVNETYKTTLQQEFYAIQQQNLKFIAEITAERNKLREENKVLSEKLKLSQQKLSPVSESDDDFIPCAQGTASVFSVKEPEGEQEYQPLKFIEQLMGPEQTESGGEKGQQSPQLTILYRSQDLFDMAENSFEKLASNTSTSKPASGGSGDQKSPIIFPSATTQNAQKSSEFHAVSNLSEGKRGQAKKQDPFTCKGSVQKTSTQKGFSWSFSSIAEEETPEIQVVSETSEEDMPQTTASLRSFTLRKETLSSNVFPLDYTNRKRSIGIPRYSERDASCQKPSSERSTLRKKTNESADAAVCSGNKPQGDAQSSILGSGIKRKARMKSAKRK